MGEKRQVLLHVDGGRAADLSGRLHLLVQTVGGQVHTVLIGPAFHHHIQGQRLNIIFPQQLGRKVAGAVRAHPNGFFAHTAPP